MAAWSSSWAVWRRFQPKVTPPSSGLTRTVRSPLSQERREEAGLTGAVGFEALGELADLGSGAAGDGFEDVSGCGEACLDAGIAGVDAAGDDAADAGDELGLFGHGDDAGGGADDVDDVAFAAASADGVPVGVEGADGDGDACGEAEFGGPVGGEGSGDVVGGEVLAADLLADAVEEGIELGEEGLGGKAAPAGVPHPLVAHGADAALDVIGRGDAGEGGGDHVAVLEGGGEAVAFVGVVAEPVEELGEAPLVGVDVAAPLDGFEVLGAGEFGDLAGLFEGAVVAPEVVVVEGLELGVDGDDGGACGVEGEGDDVFAVDLGVGEDLAGGADEGGHLLGVGLGGEVGVFATAVEGVFGCGGAEASAFAVEQRDAHAEGAEINSSDEGQGESPAV